MSDSETSSDIKVKYENSNGDNLLEDKSNAKKVLSSDTDYYFNIIANPTKVIQKKEEILNDWKNQRCNPKYMPFAGYITHPEGTTAFEYTATNFQYCIQNIQNTVVGQSIQPFTYLIHNLTKMLSSIGNSTQKTREFINLIRHFFIFFVFVAFSWFCLILNCPLTFCRLCLVRRLCNLFLRIFWLLLFVCHKKTLSLK